MSGLVIATLPADRPGSEWERWLDLAEKLAQRSLADDEGARKAFEDGVFPEVYLGAVADPCDTCKIPGAPAHEPSSYCQHRPRVVAHCTCSACFG